MPARFLYIPVPPGQTVRRIVAVHPRPAHGLTPAYATADECRQRHPGCDVWRVEVPA